MLLRSRTDSGPKVAGKLSPHGWKAAGASGGRVTGRRAVLNAPTSIYSETERAYLVYQEGAPLNLGFAYWEPHAEPEQPKPGGIFEWEFRSLETNDTRVAKTLEPLWLYNRKAQAYLFWHMTQKRLVWLKP